MPNACKYLLSLILVMSVIWMSRGQSRMQLQKLLDKNKKDIALTKEILNETQNKKVASLQLLNVYQKQIENRKSLVRNLGEEVNALEAEIEISRNEIVAITNEINEMKSQFGKLIRDGYKAQKNNSKILFIFSAPNFNQVVKRLNYLNKLLDYRKLQLGLIIKKQEENSVRINKLVNKKNEKLLILNSREEEQSKLISDQSKMEQIIVELKEKESELLASIKQKQRQANELDDQIKNTIENERNTKEVPLSPNLTPGGTINSPNFGNNIGRLPWPVKNGYISDYFGIHKHAELKNIQTENNGINIASAPGSEVFPVFEGTVSAILEVPGLKRSILLKHIGYYTVYANLEEVYVSRGDVVGTSTSIGKIMNDDDGITELHFEVWKGSEKLDPQKWLSRK